MHSKNKIYWRDEVDIHDSYNKYKCMSILIYMLLLVVSFLEMMKSAKENTYALHLANKLTVLVIWRGSIWKKIGFKGSI